MPDHDPGNEGAHIDCIWSDICDPGDEVDFANNGRQLCALFSFGADLAHAKSDIDPVVQLDVQSVAIGC